MAQNRRAVSYGDSQDWEKHDSPVVFVSKQRMDAERTLVESRAAEPLELSCIAQIRAQDLHVLARKANQSVVRLRVFAMQA
ncbi:hypothetical protein A1D31_35045 [Bradyrhizobium liaoningense]|nr:hypothetical protein A1D31_35045 [Bradyrhizobium liaoningense]